MQGKKKNELRHRSRLIQIAFPHYSTILNAILMFQTCEKVLIGELQWMAHLNGAKHKRRAHKRKKMEEEERLEKKSAELAP